MNNIQEVQIIYNGFAIGYDRFDLEIPKVLQNNHPIAADSDNARKYMTLYNGYIQIKSLIIAINDLEDERISNIEVFRLMALSVRGFAPTYISQWYYYARRVVNILRELGPATLISSNWFPIHNLVNNRRTIEAEQDILANPNIRAIVQEVLMNPIAREMAEVFTENEGLLGAVT